MLGKFNLFHLFDEIILVLLVWKIICIFLVKSCFLRYFICFPFQNWMVILTLLLLPKVSLRNLDFYLFYEVSPKVVPHLQKSTNQLSSLHTVVISGLWILITTWICWISYRVGYITTFKVPGANLNKRKWRISVISFGRNCGGSFLIFVKNLLARHLFYLCIYLFIYLFLISAQVQLITQFKQEPTQKL